jgi:signal transduction histidine kinase
MREASARARAARASELDLSLPVSGSGDEWDDLAQTLNTLLADARVGLKRVHTFTADAAHELKTPLTAILGIAQVASRRDRDAEGYRNALDEVHAEAMRLSRLVEALLTLARADAGILVPQAHRVDVGRVCMDAVVRAGRGGDITLRVPQEPACTLGDPVLLGRVVDNLLENALRHGAAPVTLTVSNGGPHVCLDVADVGRGIAPAFAPRLFERFAHGETRPGQGQGLGLSIARAIAVAHNGRLELLPEPSGAHFRLTLPAA